MATAPSLTAQVWSATGSSRTMLWLVFGGALLGTLGYWLAVSARRRARRLAIAGKTRSSSSS
jgi:hypothetical protein